MREKMYNNFSTDYDRFVNWKNRLAVEIPFLEETIQKTFPSKKTPIRILDAATGTGMHAIRLARSGFDVSGADLSEGMIERARENASASHATLRFEVAGFGSLARTFSITPEMSGPEPTTKNQTAFDIVLCLGNSLPHITSDEKLVDALKDFSECLTPGGLLILQNRNFDAVMASRERWMEPQFYREKNKEWLFLRFYDYLPDGLINFNVVILLRDESGDWKQTISETSLKPLLSKDMKTTLLATGFGSIVLYGDMTGNPYDSEKSGNLVVVARKNI
jgi:glycine/sarcosine N-methyltransferase